MRDALLALLDRLLVTHSPTGMEEEIDALIVSELQELGLLPEQDRHGNIHVRIAGRSPGPATLISAHKDEVSVIIRSIDADGRIWGERLGGCYPAKYGEGPFDIVSRSGVIEGVLCVGSTHSSELSGRIYKTKTSPLTWDLVYIDCRLDGRELAARGVKVGDRGVIGRRRKIPVLLAENTLCGYALDDKGAVGMLLLLARELCGTPPRHDVYLGFTAAEECGCSGGAYLSRVLGVDDAIALEIAPLAEEYPIRFAGGPVVVFKDAIFQYTPSLSHELMDAAARLGIACQTQVIRSFGSEASASLKEGLVGRAACLAFPTYNTHGYEMASLPAMLEGVSILCEHVRSIQG